MESFQSCSAFAVSMSPASNCTGDNSTVKKRNFRFCPGSANCLAFNSRSAVRTGRDNSPMTKCACRANPSACRTELLPTASFVRRCSQACDLPVRAQQRERTARGTALSISRSFRNRGPGAFKPRFTFRNAELPRPKAARSARTRPGFCPAVPTSGFRRSNYSDRHAGRQGRPQSSPVAALARAGEAVDAVPLGSAQPRAR